MTRIAETDHGRSEAVRAEILRHSAALFAHYGYAKTNVGDIAERCGMSPGNLYRYFRNKQAIGLAVVRRHFDLIEAAMAAVADRAGGTAEARIRAMIEVGVGHLAAEMKKTPKIVELADWLCDDEDGRALLAEHIACKRALLTGELEAGAASGELALPAPAERTASMLLNACKMWWMPMGLATWRDPATIMPELTELLELVFGGLRRAGAGRQRRRGGASAGP